MDPSHHDVTDFDSDTSSDELLGAAGFDAHAHLDDGLPPDDSSLFTPVGASAEVNPPNRPAITPAQIVALIPVLAMLLRVFGVYDLSPEQQDALSKAVDAGLVLIIGDAGLRIGRNLARR